MARQMVVAELVIRHVILGDGVHVKVNRGIEYPTRQ